MNLFILLLTLLVFLPCCAAHSSISLSRRILHQPLFPSSPPPPSDQPFFPSSPNAPTSQLPSPPPPPAPAPPPTPAKEFAISISVGIVTLGMLSALAFYIYKHKVKPIHDSPKHPTSPHDQRSAEDPILLGSDVGPTLLLPNAKVNSVKKLADRYRPSPDLQPLPPLRRQAVAPAEMDPGSPPQTTELSSSDDEGYRGSTAFYTPQGSIGSYDEGFFTPASRFSYRSTRNAGVQRSRLSDPSPKHAVIVPSIKTAPPPPPPPPPPPLPRGIKVGQCPQSNSILPTKAVSLTRRAPPPPLPPPPQSESQFQTPESKAKLSEGAENGDQIMDGERPKLKPLHWDKVRTTSDRATVWDQLKSTSSSFQLNEDMMESLFGCNSNCSGSKESATRRSVLPPVEHENRVLDPKKSQNIAILLRALNVTRDEVSNALIDGDPEALGAELLETLVKMAPTKEEEIKLKNYNGDSTKLGSAEKFLKAILDIPFAFIRVEAMLYRANFDAEVKYLRKSFDTLETASGELKNSRLFLKLLEAVLRTGNRMNVGTNRGDAKAFKLDTLLKLVDIKGTDGKTTLLHFVVQEIIRSEGTGSEAAPGEFQNQANSRGQENEFRRQGLQMVSGLSRELGSVKLAAGMDSDVLHGYVLKRETGLERVRAALKLERPDMQGGFFESMQAFLGEAEEEISRIGNDERKALTLVRDVTEYFHGNAAKEEAHPLRIFMIVRDFLSTLDHVCKDVGRMQERTVMGAARSFHISANAPLPVLNRYNAGRGDRSSEESSSP